MAVPSTPTGFYAQQGNGQAYLLWNASATALSYKIQRSIDGINYTSLATGILVLQYLDTTVTAGSQYWYKVAATNGDGDSTYTAAQNVIPSYSGDLSLQQIRLMSQQRADRVNSNFVTLPEWNTYINQSYFELYDILVGSFEDYYMAVPYTLQTTGINSYPLPDGAATFLDADGATAAPFYKLLGADLGLVPAANNARVTMRKFNFIDRNDYVYPQLANSALGVFNPRYRIMDGRIRFIPTPSSNQYITLWYVPRLRQLLQETDIAHGVSGWLEYVIVDAAIKALQKEESDVSVLVAQKQALLDRIQSMAMNRDAGEPDTISNTRGHGLFGGSGWSDEGWGGF